jgi:hypothetical protein
MAAFAPYDLCIETHEIRFETHRTWLILSGTRPAADASPTPEGNSRVFSARRLDGSRPPLCGFGTTNSENVGETVSLPPPVAFAATFSGHFRESIEAR